MNPYVPVVNQKISFCKMLLNEGIKKNRFSKKKAAVQIQAALFQSAIYHLESAYIFYLKEIGHTYRCKDIESINSLKKLQSALININKIATEHDELELLLKDEQSWLSLLLAEYKKLTLPLSLITKKNNDHSLTLLEVKQLDDNIIVEFIDVDDWLNNFKEILTRNRNLMHEC